MSPHDLGLDHLCSAFVHCAPPLHIVLQHSSDCCLLLRRSHCPGQFIPMLPRPSQRLSPKNDIEMQPHHPNLRGNNNGLQSTRQLSSTWLLGTLGCFNAHQMSTRYRPGDASKPSQIIFKKHAADCRAGESARTRGNWQ